MRLTARRFGLILIASAAVAFVVVGGAVLRAPLANAASASIRVQEWHLLLEQ